jgi:hypothetical protein
MGPYITYLHLKNYYSVRMEELYNIPTKPPEWISEQCQSDKSASVIRINSLKTVNSSTNQRFVLYMMVSIALFLLCGKGVKLTTHLYLLPGLKRMELYLHSAIRFFMEGSKLIKHKEVTFHLEKLSL